MIALFLSVLRWFWGSRPHPLLPDSPEREGLAPQRSPVPLVALSSEVAPLTYSELFHAVGEHIPVGAYSIGVNTWRWERRLSGSDNSPEIEWYINWYAEPKHQYRSVTATSAAKALACFRIEFQVAMPWRCLLAPRAGSRHRYTTMAPGRLCASLDRRGPRSSDGGRGRCSSSTIVRELRRTMKQTWSTKLTACLTPWTFASDQ